MSKVKVEAKQLGDVCSVRTGQAEDFSKRGAAVLGVKAGSINHERYAIDYDRLEEIHTAAAGYEPLACGALLLPKAGAHTAVVVDKAEVELVATNQFFILEIHPEYQGLLLPGYLAWYLNFPAKKTIHANTQGRVVPTIQKSFLLTVKVGIPTLEVQQTVVEIWNNLLREEQLFRQLQQHRRDVLAQLIENLTNER